MGFGGIFKQLEQQADKLIKGETVSDAVDMSNVSNVDSVGEDYDDVPFEGSVNPTRWEKAVVALQSLVNVVSRVDPDGLDVICFGGSDDGEFDESAKSNISVFRNVKNVKEIEKMVTSKLPSGPCNMGKAMDYVLKQAFDKGFKRHCGILVLTAGSPNDSKRLEKSLQAATDKIATTGYKEAPISVTFIHIGDDDEAEKYMHRLGTNLKSKSKSRKTRDYVDIVDTINDKDIQAAMKEIKGGQDSGKTGAIVGAFVGAAAGVGGMYLYNKKQAKKRTKGWNGKWKATYDGMEIGVLEVKDDGKGHLRIEGYPGGPTTGRYVSSKQGYNICFRDADMGWRINGDIEDEHAISWSDGSRWDEIPPKGAKWSHFAAAAAGGAATGGAVGYLLDKKFFKKANKSDQCDYIIMMDRSAKMAVKDKNTLTGGALDDDDDVITEYKPERRSPKKGTGNFIENATEQFGNMSTGDQVAIGVATVAGVAGVTAAGVGIANAVKAKKAEDDIPFTTARAINDPNDQPQQQSRSAGGGSKPSYLTKGGAKGGLNGQWRATYDGDELATLKVEDDLDGILTIHGFMSGKTIGKYARINNDSTKEIHQINFIDPDENWAVKGTMKGSREQVIAWSDDTRWDKIGS